MAIIYMGQISPHEKTKSPTKSRKPSNKIKPRKSMSRMKSKTKSSAVNFFKKYCNDSFQNNLVDAMNILLNKMENSNDKKEKAFLEKVKKNISDIAKPFLSYDNNKLTLIKKGGGKNDEKENDKGIDERTGVIVSTDDPVESINRLMAGIERAIQTAIAEGDESNRDQLLRHFGRLSERRIRIENAMLFGRIVKRREDWNMGGDVCNRGLELIFSGGAAYMSYLVITLIQGAAGLVTGAAGGLITLLCISILQSISSVVNGVTTRLPGFLGGGEVMDSGSKIINNIIKNLNDILRETPETARIIQRLNDLGYTTNMIAFMILFIFFMIILHFVRICMTANSFSIGWTGFSVGQGPTNNDLQLLADRSQDMLDNRNVSNVPETTTDQLKDDKSRSGDGKGKRSKRKTKKIKKKKTRNRNRKSKRNKKRKNRKQSKKKKKAKK
jgi:hypothetical protein